MASLADLVVGLKVNAGGFVSGLNKAKAELTNFASGAAKIGGMAGAALTGIGGFLGGAGLSVLTHRSMEAMDKVSKLSDRLAISTQSLTAFQHAAELTGAGSEAMTKGLEKMIRNIGEAATGNKTAQESFADLGLSVKDLITMSPDRQFATIADAMNKVENSAVRNKMAIDIFGKSGQGLLNTLALGSKGLADIQVEAEKLGIAFNRVDGAKIEMANDALTRSGRVFTGIGNQIAVGIAPYIKYAADKFTELAVSTGGIGNRIVSAMGDAARAVAWLSDGLLLVKAGIYAVGSGGMKLTETLIEYVAKPITSAFAFMSDGIKLIEAGFYTLASGATKAAEIMLRGFKEIYIRSTDTYNNWLMLTGKITEAEERRRFGQTRIKAQGIGLDPGLSQEYANKAVAAYDSFSRGDTSKMVRASGMAAMDTAKEIAGNMSKEFATTAVNAYDAFARGDNQTAINGFIKGISDGAQKAAEEIAAASPSMKASQAMPAMEDEIKQQTKAGGGFWGTFASSMLSQALKPSTKIDEQIKEAKKTNGLLQQILDKDEEAAFA